MNIVTNAADGKKYKVFTWRGDGGTWRTGVYEGGGFFAFRKQRYGQVVQPPRLDLSRIKTVQQASSIEGTEPYANLAREKHAELVQLAERERPDLWKMSADAIKQQERAALDAISDYHAAIKAHILRLMDNEGMIRR
jgi:hypothetical protein